MAAVNIETQIFGSVSLRDMGVVRMWDMLNDSGSEDDTGMCQRGRLLGCSPSPFPHETKIEETDFVDSVISNILHDWPFSWNQPLKLPDD
jgi:hypothetical protein